MLKTTTTKQYRVATTTCIWLFKKFNTRGQHLMSEIKDAIDDIDDGKIWL